MYNVYNQDFWFFTRYGIAPDLYPVFILDYKVYKVFNLNALLDISIV